MESMKLYSLSESGERLGVSRGTVRNWIDKGYIHAICYPSGVRKVTEAELDRMVQTVFSFASPDDEPQGPAPRRRREEMSPEDWGPAA